MSRAISESGDKGGAASAPWRQLGPYQLAARIGRGGAADVYAAQGPDGAVAVKVCHSSDHRTRLRFSREVAVLRQLWHPGLVRLYAADEDGDPAWYAMEDLGRISLREVIAASQPQAPVDVSSLVASAASAPLAVAQTPPCGLRPAVAVSLIKTIASAMAHAHSRGIIHRDLKPENVMMRGDGTPVVIDVGLAMDVDDQRFTASGVTLGTVAYMAPEQHLGSDYRIDERCDIYALGQMLSETVTGMTVRMHDEIYRQRLRALPKALRLMIRQATAEDRRWRYASMDAVVEDCRRYLSNEPLLCQTAPWWLRGWKLVCRRPRQTMGVLLAGLLLLASGATWWAWQQQQRALWQSSQDLIMPALPHAPPARSGSWSRQGGLWHSHGAASMRTQQVFPSQIDVEMHWQWQPSQSYAGHVALDIGVVQEQPAGWRVAVQPSGVVTLWWHDAPWWCGRVAVADSVHLRVRISDHTCTLWLNQQQLARFAVPAPVPAGQVRMAVADVGSLQLTGWRVRLPTVPGLVQASTLSHNLLGEAIAAEDAIYSRWRTVTEAAFAELADSRSHPGAILDQWQVLLYRESLRRARASANNAEIERLQQQLSRRNWRLDAWQQRSLVAAVGDDAAVQALNHAAIHASDAQVAAWAAWLLQRRCPHERAQTAPARAAIAARLPADDPHLLLWQDW